MLQLATMFDHNKEEEKDLHSPVQDMVQRMEKEKREDLGGS